MQHKINSKTLTFFISIIFFVMCFINLLMPYKEFSENENRHLSPFPDITLSSLLNGEFMADFEAYITDKFVLRDTFVLFKANMEKLTGRLENNAVYFGKNGYIIEKHPNFDKTALDKNLKAIKTLNSLRRYNINVATIPTAYEIEKDNLPKFAYSEKVLNEISYISSELSKSNIDFINTTDILTENKGEYLYYKTDHHQTANGSFYVYKELGKYLDYNPYSYDEFDVSTVSDSFLGSTWSKTLFLNAPADNIIKYSHKKIGELAEISYSYEDLPGGNTLFKSEYLNQKDKYSYYMGGNHPVTVIKTNINNGKNLAIFKDSYANSIVPFLALHFENIHVIDLRYFNGDIIEYLYKNQLTDILVLYNTSTFMTDNSFEKLEKYTLTSPYSKTAFGKVPKSSEVDMSYFNDAVFVGDSLTEGLRLFTNLEDYASFYCEVGSSLSGVYSNKFINVLGTDEQLTVFDAIKHTKPKKIYIMLGINDGPDIELADGFEQQYTAFVNNITNTLPDSTIYIQAIMPVSKLKDENSEFKNVNIYEYNKRLEKIAQNNGAYFLPVFEIFTDENGYLKSHITPDGVHLTEYSYLEWLEYLKTHTVPEIGVIDKKDSNIISFDDTAKTDIDSLAKQLLKEIPFEDQLSKASPNSIYATFGIDPKLLLNGIIYSGSGITAEEIAIFELKDSKNAKDITQKIEKHIKEKREAFKGYVPKELIKLKSPVVKTYDNIVVLCISPNDSASETIIDNYFN